MSKITKQFFKSLFTSIFILAYLFISSLPQPVFAQAIPPRPPQPLGDQNNIPIPEDLPDLKVGKTNSGEALVKGGVEAIESCLRQPLGEFDSVLAGQVAAMAADFFGASGLLDKFANAAATAQNVVATVQNVIGAVQGIADIASMA